MGHFFTFSAGDLAVIVTLLGTILKAQKWMDRHEVEHEILVMDYLERKGIKNLPTRRRT